MNKPYVVVHMMATLDGRIDCPVVAQVSGQEYYDALAALGQTSKLSGRVTAALECSALKCEGKPAVGAPIGKESANVTRQADEYSIVVDTHGRLQWQGNEVDGHSLIAIVSEEVSAEYLNTLTRMGISWIATGKGCIDLKRALEILADKFGVKKIAVVGGGYICGGFLSAGLVDEVSVMIAPGIDGRKGMTSVFDGIVKEDNTPYRLKLESVKQCLGTETLWLRYLMKEKTF